MVDPEVEEARQALGRQLALLRQAAGVSQKELAHLVHYGRSSVANAEAGRQNVPRDFWVLCDEALCTDGVLTQRFELIEAWHQEHLRGAAIRLAPPGESRLDVSTPWAELDAPFGIVQRMQSAGTSNIDEMTLVELEDEVSNVIRDYELLGPQLMAPRVVARRQWVHEVMQGRQPPKQASRLYLSASRLSGVLAVVALDMHRYESARTYAAEAFHLATLVGDPDAQAWVRAAQSLIEYYAGDYQAALFFATDGQRIAPNGNQAIRLAINGEARAAARLGDHRAVAAAVDRAMVDLAALPKTEHVSASLSLGPYCQARVSGNAATAYLLLGDNDQVMDHGQVAVAAFDQNKLSGPQALTRLDMAGALLNEVDPQPELAAALVADALAVKGAAAFASVPQRAREFLRTVGAWQDLPAIRDVSAQVHDLAIRNG